MSDKNFDRMLKLAEEFFGAKHDPNQISVTPEDVEKLKNIHPATLSEERDADGPVVWLIVIPTTAELMKRFVAQAITERELLEQTPLGVTYEAVYLCSILVLPERRGRGRALRLLRRALGDIRKEHPIEALFFWGFSDAGERLALRMSAELNLPLLRRPH